jgi:hypothetical protein
VVDDDPLAPYNPSTRVGGLLVLLYHYDDTEDNFVPTRPIAIGADYLQYPYTLPTPTELPQLRKFVVAIPKLTTVSCEAVDPLSGRTITSNSLTILIKAPAYQLGPWTVRQAIDDAGASIGTATYLTIDKFGLLNMVFSVRTRTDASGVSRLSAVPAEGDLFPKWLFTPGTSLF